jgi:hypothetical protein
MRKRPFRLIALLAAIVAAQACGPTIDLQTDLEVVGLETGWDDNGIGANGWNHLVPSIEFRLKNVSDHPVSSVQMTVDFWKEGDDGEWASSQIRGIGAEPLEPGAETEALIVRAENGYNLEAPRAELFLDSRFVDATAKVFARHGGKIVPVGEFKLERRIILQTTSGSR